MFVSVVRPNITILGGSYELPFFIPLLDYFSRTIVKGNLKEFYSIRINNQWRIIFKWNNSNAELVEIIDYH
jgi:plasmid maintenance system killer protein